MVSNYGANGQGGDHGAGSEQQGYVREHKRSPMSDFLTLDFEESMQVYVYGSDNKLVAVISEPSSVTRYRGWVKFTHEHGGRRAETVISEDNFSRLMVLYAIVTDSVTMHD